MMQTALLEVKNLSFSRADRVIFRNAAFSLAPKESLGLCGPIGCGKTTLLRILTGRASAGDDSFAGRSARNCTERLSKTQKKSGLRAAESGRSALFPGGN